MNEDLIVQAVDRLMTALDCSLNIQDVVRQHYATVYRYALRLSGSSSDAEDLTQQTFLIACQRLGQVRQADRVDRWLLAIVRTTFFKYCEQVRNRMRDPTSVNCDLDEVPAVSPVVDEIDREALAHAVAGLATDFRMVVLMFYFEELSYSEIARQLEIPIGTVMSRLARAKAHLRESLAASTPESLQPIEPFPIT